MIKLKNVIIIGAGPAGLTAGYELLKQSKDYKVVIVSSRAETVEGRLAIRNYLKKYNIEVDGIDCRKPPAIVYIDDRAICFNGDTTNLAEQVRNFKPWTKK